MKSELAIPPTFEEVTKTTDQQKNGKAAGIDGIPQTYGNREAQAYTTSYTNYLSVAGRRAD